MCQITHTQIIIPFIINWIISLHNYITYYIELPWDLKKKLISRFSLNSRNLWEGESERGIYVRWKRE